MSSLVTAILSIALMAIIAVVTIYFMGHTTDEKVREAKVAALVNSASQIQGALELRSTDQPGATLSSLTQLQPHYLKTIPQGDWHLNAQGVVSTLETEDECKAFNKKLGYGEVAPACDDPEFSKKTACCLSSG